MNLKRHVESQLNLRGRARISTIPNAIFETILHGQSSETYHIACMELAALIRTDLDEGDRYEDFIVFATWVSLLALRESTRSTVEVAISALHRKGHPDTTKIEIRWDHTAVDPEDFAILDGTSCSIISEELSIEMPIPPALARTLWARFALNMHYPCESGVDLVVCIPHTEERCAISS
ncbi:MAG TPA: hypothetical protein VN397_04105 [Candidatus Methylomirabilis sp.]|nr:hypothetical protein [Candidatus Methylomirabilis sp.]